MPAMAGAGDSAGRTESPSPREAMEHPQAPACVSAQGGLRTERRGEHCKILVRREKGETQRPA